MIYTEMTNKAMKLAYTAHLNQYDLSGIPYIFHSYHIAEQMKDEISVCVALLHDVIEDTYIEIKDIENIFPKEVIENLKLLTLTQDIEYFEYINQIKTNPIAKAVKLADIEHNLDQSRINNKISENKLIRMKNKYEKAKRILLEK